MILIIELIKFEDENIVRKSTTKRLGFEKN